MKIKQVSKHYGKQVTLKEVDLTIEKGSFTAFIGPNGAGKSSLMAIMSRLLPKDKGQVLIEGKEIEAWDSRELAKELSMLKQSQHYQAKLTVEELIAFGRFPYSGNRLNQEDKARVQEAISYLELEDVKGRYINTLSGGQLQRVFIAMVLVQDTDYLLLDEPLNNLDIRQGIAMMKTLRRFVDQLGKTVAIIIHDINMASQYVDNIVAFKEGEIYCSGKVQEVMQKDVLDGLFDMEVNLVQVNGKAICVYQ